MGMLFPQLTILLGLNKCVSKKLFMLNCKKIKNILGIINFFYFFVVRVLVIL